MKPTPEKIQELWELLGWRDAPGLGLISPEGEDWVPPIDLNSLFKYAVPVVIDKIMAQFECSSDLAYEILFKRWLQELQLNIPHADTALFKVCCKALGGKE